MGFDEVLDEIDWFVTLYMKLFSVVSELTVVKSTFLPEQHEFTDKARLSKQNINILENHLLAHVNRKQV